MKTVIIVGAGASGIAAASRLCEKGFDPSQITILEAENRIGGRVHTVQYGPAVIEMGAQWVHGEKDNVVHRLAAEAGEIYTDFHTLESTGYADNVECAYPRSGKKIRREQLDQFHRVIEDIYDSAEKDLKTWQKSLGEYFHHKFREHFERGSLSTLDESTAWDLLDWGHRSENIESGSHNWHKISGEGYLQYVECEGDYCTTWKRGYSVLFSLLMKNIQRNGNDGLTTLSNRVRLNSTVTSINWDSSAGKVRVECDGGQTLESDVVLVTCSLGVLKEKADRLFVPPLPQWKRKAIEGLGYGTVNKIYLEFRHPWWTREWGGINFLVTEAERVGDWTDTVLGFFTMRDQPNLLEGWLAGDAARQMETVPENQLLRECTKLLRGAIGTDFPSYEDPVKIIRSAWYTNPNFRGSYSYRSIESKEKNVWASDLAKPVEDSKGIPRLLFAGEATHDHNYSTVHAAVSTGWREADRILQITTSLNNKSKL